MLSTQGGKIMGLLIFALVIFGLIIISYVTAGIIGFILALKNDFKKSDSVDNTIKNANFDNVESDALFSFNNNFSSHKKKTGKCDGDCANCPPHYGYRHGRWYYGHNHVEGCTRGGNSCSGGRD